MRRPHVSRSRLALAWYVVIALTMVMGLGAIENALLTATAGAMGLAMALNPTLPARTAPVLAAFLWFALLYGALTIADPSFRGVSNTLAIVVSAMFFLFFAQIGRQVAQHAEAAWISLGTAVAAAVIWHAAGATPKNTVSGLCAYPILTAGLIWIARGAPPMRTAIFAFAAIGVMGILFEHRMMAGAGLIGIAAFTAIRIAPLQLTRNIVLGALIACIVLLVALFAGLWGFDIRDIDDLIKETSGRTAESGRQLIWPILFDKVSKSPWIGLGSGILPENLYSTRLSAHNHFLQVYVQTGIIGLSSFIILLALIWRAIGRPRRSEPVGIYLSACFLVLLVHLSLEVFLMQGNPTIGVGAWILFGTGVGILGGGTSNTARRPLMHVGAADSSDRSGPDLWYEHGTSAFRPVRQSRPSRGRPFCYVAFDEE